MKKKIILVFLVLILVIIVAYRYVYKEHRDITTEKGDYTTTAKDIFSEFQKNEANANAKYLDKTIEVTGTISSVDLEAKSIVIDEKLFATFKDKTPETFQPNSKTKIKGRFIGYDALMEELKMDQCILVTQ
jgi:predicted Holliday junction resolvase-like endonuclease